MNRTTESTISISDRVTVNRETLAQIIGCGTTMADKIGKSAGAKIKIGSRAFYVVAKVENYLNSLSDQT